MMSVSLTIMPTPSGRYMFLNNWTCTYMYMPECAQNFRSGGNFHQFNTQLITNLLLLCTCTFGYLCMEVDHHPYTVMYTQTVSQGLVEMKVPWC